MKWKELTDEQKIAYKAAYLVVLRNLEQAISSLTFFLTGMFNSFDDDVELRRACYRLDFTLYELRCAPDDLSKLLEIDRS